LNTPRPPLVVTADKAYDSQTARQQIKDEGALPIIPNRRNAIKQAYCPKRFLSAAAQNRKLLLSYFFSGGVLVLISSPFAH
jgi:hypothetical protein